MTKKNGYEDRSPANAGLLKHYPATDRPSDPICSICIANYNGTLLLGDCLQSIYAQAGSVSVEIIIHDDASSDGSVEFLREHYPHVTLLASQQNVGFCIANNRMAAQARGEHILFLNNDAALQPDALVTLIAAASAHARPCILTLPQYEWTTGSLIDRGCMLDLFCNPVPNLDPSRRVVALTIGACLFLPRKLWFELGGFPEWMGSIAEDMYLCCLARLHGLSVRVTSGSGYRHRQGSSFGGSRVDAGKLHTTFRRRRLSERNKTAVMMICTPTLLVWPLLVVHIIELAVEGIALTLLKWDCRIWKEIYAPTFGYVAGELGRLRILRKQVQQARRASLREYMNGVVLFPRKLSMLLRYGVPTVK